MRALVSSRQRVSLAALASLLAVGPTVACAAPPPLIPRETLFATPDHLEPVLSPDGQKLAYLAPGPGGILQIWVRTVGKTDDKPVTASLHAGLHSLQWAYDGRTLLFASDRDASGNTHVFGLDVPSGNVHDFTAFDGVSARLIGLSPTRPGEMLVQMNLRNRAVADVFRVSIGSGGMIADTQNAGDVQQFVADRDLQIRAAVVLSESGAADLRVRDDERSLWRSLGTAAGGDRLEPYEFSADGKSLLLGSSLGSNTERIIAKDLQSGAERVVAQSADADLEGLMVNPYTGAVEAAAFSPDRRRWVVLDPAVKPDLDGLAKVVDGDFSVVSRDKANKLWVVAFELDAGPIRYYLWDRATRKADLLFPQTKKLDGLSLARTKPVTLKARDGLALRGYLTLPVGGGKGLPMVLLVHSGPWARDRWGFDPEVQWLANRGYACLQVNYRGSAGLGRSHLEAGYKQWGRKMQEDLVDAVHWAIKEGVADPKRIAISGTSYGGYAALVAAGLSPDVFAAAVDVVGPSSLESLIRSIPAAWTTARATFTARVGNPDDAADRDRLTAASPVSFADRIKTPIIIAQGGEDTRAPAADTDKVVSAIEKGSAPLTYVVYKDEGHGLARVANRLDFLARTEAFLAKYLGGRVEPLAGDKQPGSSAAVAVSR